MLLRGLSTRPVRIELVDFLFWPNPKACRWNNLSRTTTVFAIMKKYAISCLLAGLLLSHSMIATAALKVFDWTVSVDTQQTVEQSLAKRGIRLGQAYMSAAGGSEYTIDAAPLNVDDLKTVSLCFDDAGLLEAVKLEFEKTKFDQLVQILDKKYSVIGRDIPFVGTKYVEYDAPGEGVVYIYAPHLSFQLVTGYCSYDFRDKVIMRSEQAKQAEHKKLEDML